MTGKWGSSWSCLLLRGDGPQCNIATSSFPFVSSLISHRSPSCMPYWSLSLLLLAPFVTFLQPGFMAMATLSTILEESDGAVDIMEEDEDEVQLVPETQLADDYGDFDFDDHARYDSVTPRTARVLDANRPSSSHRPAAAMEEISLFLTRPKSSGEDSLKGFQFAKHEQPKMDFSRNRSQLSPSPKVQEQNGAEEQPHGKYFSTPLQLSSLTSMQQTRKQYVPQSNIVRWSNACSHHPLVTITIRPRRPLSVAVLLQAMPIISQQGNHRSPRATERGPRSKPAFFKR